MGENLAILRNDRLSTADGCARHQKPPGLEPRGSVSGSTGRRAGQIGKRPDSPYLPHLDGPVNEAVQMADNSFTTGSRDFTVPAANPPVFLAAAPIERRHAAPLSVLRIQKMVAEEFGITLEQLVSQSPGCRQSRFARPRQLAMWLTRRATDYSFPAIGRHFGPIGQERDHTTVMHAVSRIEERLSNDPDYAEVATVLLARLPSKSEPKPPNTYVPAVFLKPCSACDRVETCRISGFCWKAARATS